MSLQYVTHVLSIHSHDCVLYTLMLGTWVTYCLDIFFSLLV